VNQTAAWLQQMLMFVVHYAVLSDRKIEAVVVLCVDTQ